MRLRRAWAGKIPKNRGNFLRTGNLRGYGLSGGGSPAAHFFRARQKELTVR